MAQKHWGSFFRESDVTTTFLFRHANQDKAFIDVMEYDFNIRNTIIFGPVHLDECPIDFSSDANFKHTSRGHEELSIR